MKRKNTLLKLLVGIAIFSFILGLFGSVPLAFSQEEPLYGGTLLMVQADDPSKLNPVIHLFDACHMISNQIYDKLVNHDQYYNIQPELAESWSLSEEGLTYTFNLVRNAKWHDGTPLTAADVKFTYESIKEFGANKRLLEALDYIETPDDYTVVMHLSEVNAPFMDSAAGFFILPKHLFEGTDFETNPYSSAPVGSGPFKFVEWVKEDHITLEANPDYWRGRPYLDKLIYKVIPDPTTALTAFEAGEVDMLTHQRGIPWIEIPRFKEMEGVTYLQHMTTAYWCIGFNTEHPILGNLNVRKAIAYAIDNQKIVDVAYIGINFPASNAGPFPPVVEWCWNPDAASYDYDKAKAEQLLDDAGYPVGADGWRFTLSLNYVGYYSGDEDMFLMIKDMLQDVGIKIVLDKNDWATHFERVKRKDPTFEIVWAWGGSVDPDGFGRYFITNETYNYFMYSNQRVDELFELGKTIADKEERKAIYYEIAEIIADELPRYPIQIGARPQAVKAEFKGFVPFWQMNFKLSNVWWTGGSSASPESVQAVIEDAEDEISQLEGRGYKVDEAVARIQEAWSAFNEGNYDQALTLAMAAPDLAEKPTPWATYAAAAAAIIIIIAVAYIWRFRRS